MMNMLPRSILLIDRNKKERLPIAMMLSRFGYQVRMVTHGKEARKCIEGEGFDLIIVNDELADMTGLHLLGQNNKACNSRVIFLSAKGSLDEFVQVVNLGVFEYVRKPISPVQFAVIVCDFFIENIKGYQVDSRAVS